MVIAGKYSFNNGEEYINKHYPHLLIEVESIIRSVNAANFRTKMSNEKTMMGQVLYSPRELNKEFKVHFAAQHWAAHRVKCKYTTEFYTPTYKPRILSRGAFREMDFVKEQLGVEVQFGKYAFMVYNVCAKMTIFHKLGIIKAGIEVVPTEQLAGGMSTGVSYFEQFIWDLQNRGVSDIDIPVLIIGLDDERGGHLIPEDQEQNAHSELGDFLT